MTAPFPTSRTPGIAAKRPQASSSVASVASGYEHSLRPGLGLAYRCLGSTICVEGDR
jgi:hypothetical protein